MAVQTTLRGEQVIYIDTDGSFSGRRFAAMHERLAGGNPGADLVAALRCVDLFRVYDLHSLLELLSALQARLKVWTCATSTKALTAHLSPLCATQASRIRALQALTLCSTCPETPQSLEKQKALHVHLSLRISCEFVLLVFQCRFSRNQ